MVLLEPQRQGVLYCFNPSRFSRAMERFLRGRQKTNVGDRKLTRNQAFDSEDPDDLVLGSEQ